MIFVDCRTMAAKLGWIWSSVAACAQAERCVIGGWVAAERV